MLAHYNSVRNKAGEFAIFLQKKFVGNEKSSTFATLSNSEVP
jgi:hypothetical protein